MKYGREDNQIAAQLQYKEAMDAAHAQYMKAVQISSRPRSTGPEIFSALCECNVLPWEDCIHTLGNTE